MAPHIVHSLCAGVLAFLSVNLKHIEPENQFADVFTKVPTAPMLRLLQAG